MGLSGISTTELLIILLIVVLLFGTKHVKTLGSDLGEAIRSFRSAMSGRDEHEAAARPALARGGDPRHAQADGSEHAAAPDEAGRE